jgi:hypothetical protein
VTATPGPIEATKLSKMRVKLDWEIMLAPSPIQATGPTHVVRSADMKDPTDPCGQPVPPYAMESIETWVGFGPTAELVVVAAGGAGLPSVIPRAGSAPTFGLPGAARTAAAKARTGRIASMLKTDQ